jgi:hypothetical protein
MSTPEPVRTPRYGGYVGLLAVLILVLITINTIVTKPNGVTGIAPGQPLAPFAVPLAQGTLKGDADTATHADEGAAGRVPACSERGPQILNICQLYSWMPAPARRSSVTCRRCRGRFRRCASRPWRSRGSERRCFA